MVTPVVVPQTLVQCALFPECGGCQTLDLAYALQLKQKQKRLKDLLEPWKQILAPIVPSPSIEAYRNKVLFPVTPRSPLKMGMFKSGTHKVVPATHCPVTYPQIMQLGKKVLKVLNKHRIPGYNEHNYKGVLRYILLRFCPQTQQSLLVLITRSPIHSEAVFEHLWEVLQPLGLVSLFSNINTQRHNVILAAQSTLVKGQAYYQARLLGRTFLVGSQSFYQTNTGQAEVIYQQIAQTAEGHPGLIWDLYCGLGTIAQTISTSSPVLGVESTPEAVELGREAVKMNGLSQVTLLNEDVDQFLEKPQARPQLVVVNPPRTGLSASLIGALKRLKPPALLYLSCNPKSFKKNIEDLSEVYALKYIKPYDMFPHTDHIELLGYLRRK
jgi:23S rRNA (uracil1939-C5)-methyltransferase